MITAIIHTGKKKTIDKTYIGDNQLYFTAALQRPWF